MTRGTRETAWRRWQEGEPGDVRSRAPCERQPSSPAQGPAFVHQERWIPPPEMPSAETFEGLVYSFRKRYYFFVVIIALTVLSTCQELFYLLHL